MRKIKFIVIIFTALLIFPSFLNIALADVHDVQQEKNDKPVIDFLRGLDIEFKPPNLILDCGSLFFLNVNLTKCRILPIVFSISVFLRMEDEFGKSKTTRIGQLPFVYIPPLHRKTVSISVPCLTTNDLLSNLYSIGSKEKNELRIKEADIGVKIDRVVRWTLDDLIWSAFMNNGFKIKNWSLLDNNEIIWRLFISESSPIINHPLNKIRIVSFLQKLNSFIKNFQYLIVWEKVNVASPFVCSKKILFECEYVDNETDDKGNFIVNVSITNNLDEDVTVFVLVDTANEPFFNSLLPMPKETLYNVGFLKDTIISAGTHHTATINCSFKNESLFRKNYTLTIECVPYIPIGNTNQFGVLFFDIRWLTATKPKYVVDGNVQSSIQKGWYNLPIFYGVPESATLFPTEHHEIFYNGPEPTDKLLDFAEALGNEVKSWIYLYFFITLLLIGFACIGYFFIKKVLHS